jgi:N-acetylmuramoyl-L-alanine amidase
MTGVQTALRLACAALCSFGLCWGFLSPAAAAQHRTSFHRAHPKPRSATHSPAARRRVVAHKSRSTRRVVIKARPRSNRIVVGHQAVRHVATRHVGANRRVATLHKIAKHRVVAAAKPLIVIDPGHGGKDPGAIGRSGVYEKTIALKTALTLRTQLLATHRYRVALTRTTDVFVPLARRLAFARSHHAALMISIHANASPDPKAHGASVFVRTPVANDDRITKVVTGATNGDNIASALTPRPGSLLLQSAMINSLDDDITMVDTPARDAHLFVLRSQSIPSVLVEMGFVSNRQDERLLKQAKYRCTIAKAIRDAINDYYAAIAHPGAITA